MKSEFINLINAWELWGNHIEIVSILKVELIEKRLWQIPMFLGFSPQIVLSSFFNSDSNSHEHIKILSFLYNWL